jgi:hypothetical protein
MEDYGYLIESFPTKDTHNTSWVSRDGQIMNQIYHTLTERTQARSIINVRTYRANNDSKHYLAKGMHKAGIQTRKKRYRKEHEKIIWNSYERTVSGINIERS